MSGVMSSLHYLYEYSLTFFMDTIHRLLDHDETLRKIDKKQYDKRKETIYNLIFEKVFLRVSNSLLSKDLVIFCLKLVSIKLQGQERALFDALIAPTRILNTKLSPNLLGGALSEDQLKQLEELTNKPRFSTLVDKIEDNQQQWLEFLHAGNPEDKIPKFDN